MPSHPLTASSTDAGAATSAPGEIRHALVPPRTGPTWIRVLGELPPGVVLAVDTAVASSAAALATLAFAVPAGWAAAAVVLTLLGLSHRRVHSQGSARRRPSAQLGGVAVGTIEATVMLLAARSLAPSGASAPALLALGVGIAAALLTTHSALQLVARSARRRGAGTVPTLIVGAGVVGRQLERRMREHPELGFAPVGFLDDDPSPAGRQVSNTLGIVLGPTAALPEVIERSGARHVVFSFTRAPDSEVLPLLRDCQRLGIDVSVMPRLFENVSGRVRVEQLAGLPLLALRQTNPRSWQFAIKHGGDRVVAAILLILLFPLLAAIAAAVRLSSPGAVLYRQERVGRDGRSFRLLKFRSMRPGSAQLDPTLLARLEAAGVGPGGIEGEDRRTPIGRFLRRSGLDELPQLVNVVRGEMSLVGPRPERPELADRFGERVRRYDDRHLVRAGITGWAQVNGLRGQTSIAERIEWDNWYIQNWSLGLDLLTVALTPLAILRTPKEEAGVVARPGAAAEG